MGRRDLNQTPQQAFNMPEKSHKRHYRKSDSDASDHYEETAECHGLIMERHTCTDILCSLLFLTFISVLIAVSAFAYANGNPNDLILPHDSEGRMCGKTKGVEDKPNLFFFDITRCISLTTAITGCSTKQICVKECPQVNSYKKIPGHKDRIKEFCDPQETTNCPDYLLSSGPVLGRCVPKGISNALNETIVVIQAFDEEHNKSVPIQVPDINGPSDLTFDMLKKSVKYLKDVLDIKKTFELAYEDLSECVWVILIGLVLGAVIAFAWMFLLRFIIKPMIYVTILVVLALLGFGSYLCIGEYIKMNNVNSKVDKYDLKFDLSDLKYLSSLKETWLVSGIVTGVIFLVLFFVIIFIRKRIRMAAELIKEVSKAIVLIPASLVWPFIPFVIEICVIAYCSSTALYLASSGIQLFKIIDTNLTDAGVNLTRTLFQNDFTIYADEAAIGGEFFLSNSTGGVFKVGDYCEPNVFYAIKNSTRNDTSLQFLECFFFKYGYDTKLRINVGSDSVTKYYTKVMEFINEYQWLPQAYVLFMLFWLTAFMIGLNEMTLAGAFGTWYWTRLENVDKGYKNRLPFLTVLGSVWRALFYHLGTIAFGSLLIAIVKIIRVILDYLSRKLKPKVEVSKVAKYLVCCLKCCFWCLERFIKFLNRYAFIITAVYSLNFCRAANKAFKLITTNILRVFIIDKITGFILFLSNLAITAIIGILAFFYFTKKLPGVATPDLNYYFVPLLIIVIGVFTITKLFFDVFSMGVDTILICVLIDVDSNDGSKSRPYFMSTNLKRLLNISNKRRENM